MYGLEPDSRWLATRCWLDFRHTGVLAATPLPRMYQICKSDTRHTGVLAATALPHSVCDLRETVARPWQVLALGRGKTSASPCQKVGLAKVVPIVVFWNDPPPVCKSIQRKHRIKDKTFSQLFVAFRDDLSMLRRRCPFDCLMFVVCDSTVHGREALVNLRLGATALATALVPSLCRAVPSCGKTATNKYNNQGVFGFTQRS